VELPELHVLEWQAARAAMPRPSPVLIERVGRRGEDASRAASGQHRDFRLQDHYVAGFHLVSDDTYDIAIGIGDEIERHPFDEELRARPHVALVERVQHRVAVRSAAAHARCTFSPKFAE
jgi:hypothetical protein